jgi:hypothetical protein
MYVVHRSTCSSCTYNICINMYNMLCVCIYFMICMGVCVCVYMVRRGDFFLFGVLNMGGRAEMCMVHTTLRYITLYYIALHYTTLYCPQHKTLHYITLHYTTPNTKHYTTQHYTTLHYTTLHYTTTTQTCRQSPQSPSRGRHDKKASNSMLDTSSTHWLSDHRCMTLQRKNCWLHYHQKRT